MPSQDTSVGYALIGSPKTVTLTRPANIQGTQPQVNVTCSSVRESPLDQEDFVKYKDLLDGIWKRFTVWAAELNGYQPGNGWLVTDDAGDVYEVRHRELLSRRQRYRLYGKRRG